MATRRGGSLQIAGAVFGNAFEWYNYTVYGYLAATIATLFFPHTAAWTPLLETLALSAVAFLVRPLGGIVLGHYADRLGRRSILLVVIFLMSLGTATLAAAPVYATVGILAPLTLLAARLIQGLAAGGEFGSATAFLVEHAPARGRGLYGSWQMAGQGVAILLSGLVGSLLAAVLTPAEIAGWGWRLPFVFGLLLAPVGLYLRLAADETPAFRRILATAAARRRAPIAVLLAEHKAKLLIGTGMVIGGSAAINVLFIFMPTYALRVLGMEASAASIGPAVAGLTLALGCPVAGWLSDRLSRKGLMAGGAGVLLIALYPAFVWLGQRPSGLRLALVEMVFGTVIAAYAGPFGTALAEQFPTAVRASAMAVAYNIGVALFGGLSPFAVAWVIARTGNPLAPAYYVMAALALSIAATLALPRLPVADPGGLDPLAGAADAGMKCVP